MNIRFYKYQGTGNDFIMIDNRRLGWKPGSEDIIARMCHRRFGIGADGFILLEDLPGHDFKMVYYNSDGRESSMCGNGGRCIVQFASDLGIHKDVYEFKAVDGDHLAKIQNGIVSLQMINVAGVEARDKDVFLNTGSPHHVVFRKKIDNMNLIAEAHKVRYSKVYKSEGVNVNFVEITGSNTLKMRTYERGVEDETYSCGTGVTAAALASYSGSLIKQEEVEVKTRGGDLRVSFRPSGKGFEDIWLSGPAVFVFKGEIEL